MDKTLEPKSARRKKNTWVLLLVVASVVGIYYLVKGIEKYLIIRDLDSMVKAEILPATDYETSYSISGYYGNNLTIKVKDDFDSLRRINQWLEMKKLSEIYEEKRIDIIDSHNHNIISDRPNESVIVTLLFETTKNNYSDIDSSRFYVNGDYEPFASPSENTTESKPSEGYDPTEDEKAFAWGIAKKAVLGKLKSPSTAQFPFSYLGQDIKKSTGNTFNVNSYVEAENSLGAKIRANFTVTFQRTGDNTADIIDVSIDE